MTVPSGVVFGDVTILTWTSATGPYVQGDEPFIEAHHIETVAGVVASSDAVMGTLARPATGQGLTLVNFSAQLETFPWLTPLSVSFNSRNISVDKAELTCSRNVDECKPLPQGRRT
jgi:hypothetical protein